MRDRHAALTGIQPSGLDPGNGILGIALQVKLFVELFTGKFQVPFFKALGARDDKELLQAAQSLETGLEASMSAHCINRQDASEIDETSRSMTPALSCCTSNAHSWTIHQSSTRACAC